MNSVGAVTPSFENAPLPQWLTVSETAPSASITYAAVKLRETQFNNMFDRIIDKIAEGIPLTSALKTDVRPTDYSDFLKWVRKDPLRKARYYEAQEVGAEIIAAELITIADGKDSFEDVQRSTLRINTRKFLLGVWNKRRFGEVKQIEMNGQISITKALDAAHGRAGQIIDATFQHVIEDESCDTENLGEDPS